MRFALMIISVLALLSACSKAADERHDGSLLSFTATADVKATMDKLESVVTERGFKVFARIDHAAGAASVGADLRPTELLIFGNPQGGAPLMQAAQTIAIDLPLKALVWQAEDGVEHVSFNDPAFLAARHGMKEAAPMIERMTGLLTGLAAAAGAK